MEPTRRVLAIHFTKPSNSEANVVSNLLWHLDAGIGVKLLVNRAGNDDRASHLARLPVANSISLQGLDVGLPIDPQKPRSFAARVWSRLEHVARRGAAVRAAEAYRPDVVYTSQQRYDCRVGELISRRLGVPHIVHLHYTPGPWLGERALARLRSCHRVLAISEFVGRLAARAGVDRARLVVLPNTIDLPREAPPGGQRSRTGDSVTVGQIGRMAPGKGFDDSLRAFAKLKERQPSARFVLVGDGSERRELERLADRLGLKAAVEFSGWQADATRRLSSFDIFLSPSRNEPFGLAALEASAAGVPVVAYDEGGTAEIVVHRETGILARPGDVDGLAAALIELSADAALRESFGKSGRHRAATVFDPKRAARVFSDVLRDAARSR